MIHRTETIRIIHRTEITRITAKIRRITTDPNIKMKDSADQNGGVFFYN